MSLPPEATKGSLEEMSSANSAFSVCPVSTRSGTDICCRAAPCTHSGLSTPILGCKDLHITPDNSTEIRNDVISGVMPKSNSKIPICDEVSRRDCDGLRGSPVDSSPGCITKVITELVYV